MLKIEKNGLIELYDSEKIKKSFKEINKELSESDMLSEQEMDIIIGDFEKNYDQDWEVVIKLEQLEDFLEKSLINKGKLSFWKLYILTRYKKDMENKISETDKSILWLVNNTNEEVWNENSNKDARIAPTQRDLIAGEISKHISMKHLLSPEIVEAHKNGTIHFHDLDYYVQKWMFNCCLVNIKDMLENGTVMNGKLVERPKSFQVACTVLTQIIAAVASSQYGGQTMNVKHLAVFLYETRQKFRRKLHEQFEGRLSEEVINEIAEQRLKEELSAGIQTIQYQINTLMGTNWQSPFVTLFLELDPEDPYIQETAMIIEEIFKQRITGIKNEVWIYVTPAFPKLVYVLDEWNNLTGWEYDYVTKLAVQCSAKRMYPDYISAKKMRENNQGNVFGPMWCRAFLSPYKDKNWNYKFEWRFNQWVVTLNLPQIWIETQWKSEEEFWKLLDERCELVFKALMERHNALKWTKAEYAPLLWQHGGLARLNKDDVIDNYLENGYSTISMWYIGIYETTYLVKKCSHTTEEWKAFALKLLQALRDKIEEWKERTWIWFALYGTPAESLCYRFAKIDKERFGDIHNVTDKWYYTNSYHVDVREEIDAFSKLNFESEFQPISSWGAISYVEIPNMTKNLKALETLVKYIYDNIQYAEFNTKCDCCQSCGYEWEMLLDENNDWYCPNCQNRDKHKMTVVRRTCFTKDNLVLTKKGYKNIDEVEIWDEVLTFKNRYKPVVEKSEFENKEVIKISSPAIDEIICTPDHPFYIRSLRNGTLSEIYIKQAKYLDENDYLLSLKNNREIDVDINNDYFQFNSSYKESCLSTGAELAEWISLFHHWDPEIDNYGLNLTILLDLPVENAKMVLIGMKERVEYYRDMFRDMAWIHLSTEKQEYAELDDDNIYEFIVPDRKLAYGIKNLFAKVYGTNMEITKENNGYHIKWYKIQPKESQVFYKDWYLHSPVTKVEEFWKDKVYSLTVLDDASYTVNEVAVLNCGYLGSNYFNKGKTKEIKNRVLHI